MFEGRWKLIILFHLFGGEVRRFSELEREIPAISQKMLMQQVRQMEADGMDRRRVELPSRGLLAAKHHARGRCFRDQSLLLVGYSALHITNRAAPLHDGSFRSESCLPDRTKEIDFQFDRSEGFLRREGARKRHSHRGVSNIAKNPAVQRPHGICMLGSGCQADRGPSITYLFRLKSNQTRHRYVVRRGPRPEVRFS